MEKLKAVYGDLYGNDNVLISGIHTHSGPAGYFQYVLFEVRQMDEGRQTAVLHFGNFSGDLKGGGQKKIVTPLPPSHPTFWYLVEEGGGQRNF